MDCRVMAHFLKPGAEPYIAVGTMEHLERVILLSLLLVQVTLTSTDTAAALRLQIGAEGPDEGKR